mgnify:CR=1 FL=1
MDIASLIISLVSGAAGGNVAGSLMKDRISVRYRWNLYSVITDLPAVTKRNVN